MLEFLNEQKWVRERIHEKLLNFMGEEYLKIYLTEFIIASQYDDSALSHIQNSYLNLLRGNNQPIHL